jgi:hypothetical protein
MKRSILMEKTDPRRLETPLTLSWYPSCISSFWFWSWSSILVDEYHVIFLVDSEMVVHA